MSTSEKTTCSLEAEPEMSKDDRNTSELLNPSVLERRSQLSAPYLPALL